MLTDVYTSERAALTQTVLNKILRYHEMYVARQGGMRAALRSANLSGAVLANRNLSGADLSGASLVGANLHGTNLSGASLYCADLRGCDLRNARLERADLRGAAFKGADLAFAILDYADIRAATMMYVGTDVTIRGTPGDGNHLGAVDFSNCSMRNVSFGNARLDNVNFTNALLSGAIFRGAKLTGACFDGAVLTGVNLADVDVPPEVLSKCLTAPTQAAQQASKDVLAIILAHHEWITSSGKRGSVGTIDGHDIRPIGNQLKGLNLAGLSARQVVAVGADFSACQLQAAKFYGADLRAACFADADLSGADLDHTKLAHATFQKARIHDFKLQNGDILATRADMAQGTKGQFAEADIQSPSFLTGLA